MNNKLLSSLLLSLFVALFLGACGMLGKGGEFFLDAWTAEYNGNAVNLSIQKDEEKNFQVSMQEGSFSLDTVTTLKEDGCLHYSAPEESTFDAIDNDFKLCLNESADVLSFVFEYASLDFKKVVK